MNENKMVEKVAQCKRCGRFFEYIACEDSELEDLCDSCRSLLPSHYDYKRDLGGILKSEIKEKIKNMVFDDKICICEGCGEPYVISAKEQEFDAGYGILERPQLCSTCISEIELRRMEIEDLFDCDILSDDNFPEEEIHIFIESEISKGFMLKGWVPWLNVDLNEFILNQCSNAFRFPYGSYLARLHDN